MSHPLTPTPQRPVDSQVQPGKRRQKAVCAPPQSEVSTRLILCHFWTSLIPRNPTRSVRSLIFSFFFFAPFHLPSVSASADGAGTVRAPCRSYRSVCFLMQPQSSVPQAVISCGPWFFSFFFSLRRDVCGGKPRWRQIGARPSVFAPSASVRLPSVRAPLYVEMYLVLGVSRDEMLRSWPKLPHRAVGS